MYSPASPKSALISGVAIFNNSTTSLQVTLFRGAGTIYRTASLAASTSAFMSDVVELASTEGLNAQASTAPLGGGANISVLLFGIERD